MFFLLFKHVHVDCQDADGEVILSCIVQRICSGCSVCDHRSRTLHAGLPARNKRRPPIMNRSVEWLYIRGKEGWEIFWILWQIYSGSKTDRCRPIATEQFLNCPKASSLFGGHYNRSHLDRKSVPTTIIRHRLTSSARCSGGFASIMWSMSWYRGCSV